MPTRPAPLAARPLARPLVRLGERIASLWPRVSPAPEAKASASGPLIALQTMGQPAWTPKDYAAFAREGMMQNAIVYRSVRMIAEAAASVPLLLYERDTEIVEHPFLDLLARPNRGQTGTDLMEAWFGFLLVSGNGYLETVALGGNLRELHALRPDRVKVVPGADGWPEAYDYNAGGSTVRIAGDAVPNVARVLQLRLFHPANDHYGLSPIEAAATAIDLHNAAARWNKALLDNSARPSGALVYSNGANMTADQFARLKSELESSFQGTQNAGRPLLLEGGLDWKAMSLSPRDLDFMEAKHAAAREIALAIGVPPMLLGIPGDNTYSNYAEAQRAFWRQTVLPLVNRAARALTMWLVPAYGGDLRLAPDLDQVEALSPEREALWARLDAASFLTDDEKRAAAGYGPKDAEVADDSTGPFGAKYNPNHDELGRFASGPGGGTRNPQRVAQNLPRGGTGRPRGGLGTGVVQQMRLARSRQEADEAIRRVRELDPQWRPSPRIAEGVEGEIARNKGEAAEAEARLRELLRDASGSPPDTPVSIPPGKVIRNEPLAGQRHPKTGVPFDNQGVPDFSGVARSTVQVPHTGNRWRDDQAANRAAGLNSTPKDMTWHHHQDGNTMQLVPRAIHSETGHTGSIGIGNLPGRKGWEIKQMYPRMSDPNTPIQSGKLDEFEARIHLGLPESYKSFLQATNGGQPERRAFPVKDYEDDNLAILNQFSGLGADKPSSDLLEDYDFFAGRIPDGIIVIGHTDGGDHLCFDLRNDQQKVVLWDQRHFWGTGEWREQDVYQVADRFDELLAAMYPNPYT